MTQNEITAMSAVNQSILEQVTSQTKLVGAMVRKGSDQLQVVVRELGPNTLRLSNLQATEKDGDLFMNTAIRYQPAPDTYDALVAHAHRAENGFDIAYRYELIAGLYFDQFAELLAGEYCNAEGNAVTVEDAQAWEKAEIPTLLIFSASEKAGSGAGYWSSEDGWVESAKHASLFSVLEREAIEPYRMPLTAGNDAVWVVAASLQTTPRKNAGMSM